jgi:hypothetical protein
MFDGPRPPPPLPYDKPAGASRADRKHDLFEGTIAVKILRLRRPPPFSKCPSALAAEREIHKLPRDTPMNDDTDRNYISFGDWMWMIFVTCIPVAGQIMALVWAFSGENQTKRNFFQAAIAWALLSFVALAAWNLFFSDIFK